MAKERIQFAGGSVARYTLLAVAFGLSMLGLVMIYSASSITAAAENGTSAYYLLRQLLFIALGAAVALFFSRFDYRLWRSRLTGIWGLTIGLLLLTIVLGVVRGGARRWISLGLFNLQPSELTKIACVMIVAALAVEWQRGRIDTFTFLKRAGLYAGVPALLIILQPDLGTAVTLFFAVAVVLFLAGVSMRWVVTAGMAAVGIAVLAIAVEPYRMKRMLSFIDPWADPLGKGYQSIQALMAFGTGGLSGAGLGLSRQKFFYLPEAHTDFIFAIVGEEIGLIGTLLVVAGFVLFVWAGFKIAVGSRDPFGRLLAGGLTGMLGFQGFLNMAAVTGVMPVTGKPLPFVSYGGSSMIVTMICLGLILSVSRYGAYAPRAVRVRPAAKEPKREGVDERRRDRRARVSRSSGGRAVRRRA